MPKMALLEAVDPKDAVVAFVETEAVLKDGKYLMPPTPATCDLALDVLRARAEGKNLRLRTSFYDKDESTPEQEEQARKVVQALA